MRSIQLPKCLYLEVTNRCNLRCSNCIQLTGIQEPLSEMTRSDVERITSEFEQIERVALHGAGEPLLNPELMPIIQHLKSKGAHVMFNTNGILLDERVCHALIEAGLDELRISLDAASAETYKAIRNSDQFEAILNNLRRLSNLEATERFKSSVWFIGSRKNIHEFPDFVRLAASLNIKEVYLQRLVIFLDQGNPTEALSEFGLQGVPEAESIISESRNLARALGIAFNSSGLGRNERVQPGWRQCRRPWEVMYITANGNVLPCCISPFSISDYPSLILGNVFETGVKDVWFGDRLADLRCRIATAEPPHYCRGCGPYWSL